jgi:nitrogen fixation NifU-like protein
MYSSIVLDHLDNPRHVGEVSNASARGESSNPVCGDRMTLTLRVSNGTITEARFLVDGCPPSIAAGSMLTVLLTGLDLAGAERLTPRQLSDELGRLPRHKEHCAVLAIDALRTAIVPLKIDAAEETRQTNED